MALDPHFKIRAVRRGLRSFSDRYHLGWVVPINSNWDTPTAQRYAAAQRIMGIPESRIGSYPVEQMIGPKGDGNGGWLFHPSNYWSAASLLKKIQNALRLRRHIKALATFRATHGHVRGTAISEHGVRFIAGFEGFAANWYDDGTGTMTIGYGHTNEGGVPRPPITNQQALDLLHADLVTYERAVRNAIKYPLTVNQFDALVSFVYNLGPGVLNDGIAALINHGHLRAATNLMLQYDHANGQRWLGLTRRRQAEVKLFWTP